MITKSKDNVEKFTEQKSLMIIIIIIIVNNK